LKSSSIVCKCNSLTSPKEPRAIVLPQERRYLIKNEHLILPPPLAVTELGNGYHALPSGWENLFSSAVKLFPDTSPGRSCH